MLDNRDSLFAVPTFDFYFKVNIPKANKERLILQRNKLGQIVKSKVPNLVFQETPPVILKLIKHYINNPTMCYIQIMGEAPDAEKQPVPVVDRQSIKKPLVDRVIHKIFETPERTTEFLSGQIMMGLEIVHDMDLYPAKYGLTPNQVGSLPDPNTAPAAAWAVDHIGDIWEISAGFTAMRLGFVAANEALKKIPAAKGYQIPDEACFWASLATTVTVKAIHSMGWISLFHIHDHMGHPVPGMLFGQGVAAVVLAASHYAAKYREPIKDLALRIGGRVAEEARFVGGKFKELDEKTNALWRSDATSNIAVSSDEQNKK